MSEKIILRDLNVLAICPSDKWSSLERRAIFDCTYLRNIGGSPVLLCYKNSQVAIEAEREDIKIITIKRKKISTYRGLSVLFEVKKVIEENQFEIVHCYDLATMWATAFILKSDQKIPLFFTFNQNIKNLYHHFLPKWLLKRVDNIFTLSEETYDFVMESFSVGQHKVKNIGCGLEVVKVTDKVKGEITSIGCVIDNLTELRRLKFVIKVFRILSNENEDRIKNLQLWVFLGPRIYQRDQAKLELTSLDNEFYEGDIFLFSLENKKEELKKIDVFFGLAFDEPLNDYELISIINEIPVVLPRTAMRQNLMSKFSGIGESYFKLDVREAKSKIIQVLSDSKSYKKSLEKFNEQIRAIHGIDSYAHKLEKQYSSSFGKRQRFVQKKRKA